MSRRSVLISAFLLAAAVVPTAAPLVLEAQVASKSPARETTWQYKVEAISYNPGERLTNDQRAKQYENAINENAKKGWELVGSILDRDTVQTVGGGVTTRDTVSFLAYKRAGR
ncbi:MAG: DUF4177 domain-containing protein [Isosphaeraceae bacterium]|nr:DUF4177 domain-containing protein [Isosphaeraceae bacterium]